MSVAARQLDLDLAPTHRSPLRALGPAPNAAMALELRRRTPSGDGPGPAGRRLTLDDTLVGVWEGLLARRTVRCPVCRQDAMAPADGPGSGGRCDSCHTLLS